MRTFNDIKAGDTIYKLQEGYSKIEKLRVFSVTRLEDDDVYIQFDNTLDAILFNGTNNGDYVGSNRCPDDMVGFFIILDHEHKNGTNVKQTWDTIGPGDKIYKMRLDVTSSQVKTDWICIRKIGYINIMHTLIIIDTSNRIINLSYFNNLKGDTLISTNKTIFSIYKSNAESALVEILKRKLAENLEQMDLLEKSIIKLQAQIDSL